MIVRSRADLSRGSRDAASAMQDVGKEEGEDDAHDVESQVRAVDKVAAETRDHDVDDEDYAVDNEQVVLLVIGCKTHEEIVLWMSKS